MPIREMFKKTLVVAVLGGAAAGCSRHVDADPRLAKRVVRLVTVRPAGSSDRGFTGVIAARVQSNLGFRVGGKIVARLVDVGQSVKAGQSLMRVDRTDLEHAIEAQQGAVAAARARVVQADADELRFRKLLATGAVSNKAYEEAKAAADSAQALFSSAQAQARIAQDEARYSQLAADADGVVVDVLAEPGQVVGPGQIVIKLAHAGPREAVVYLPETWRPAVGSAAIATLFNGAGTVPARLRQLSSAADPQTRTFEARYVLDVDAAAAPLGATVTVRISERAAANGFEVPVGALRDDGGGAGIWVFDPRTSAVSLRHVEVRHLGDETAVVDGNVQPNDQIVALGAHLLHEGENVQAADPEASR